MSLLKLNPSYKDYLWGGHRLVDEYGKDYKGDILAESWELSCHPDGPSTIANGEFKGLTLNEYIDKNGKEVLGENCKSFKDFPVLIKLIDARDNLSIQVHPDNEYALKNEGQYGKTEMWYIVDAKKDAFLYYGFKEEISKEEFAERIENDTLLDVLNPVPVQKGDVLFIKSGTIHAIGKDILIAEIQQNSNVTYRVYDYGRVGVDGKKRELHIDKALDVTNRAPAQKDTAAYPHIADCDYFTVDKLVLDGKAMNKLEGNVDNSSFLSILVLDGEGTITNDGTTLAFKKGESFLLPANSGKYEINGKCEALFTRIRAKKNAVKIGIDIGGTSVKIGLVDKNNKLFATSNVVTDYSVSVTEMIQKIASAVLELLAKENISISECLSVGMGVPGTLDKKAGNVIYSNNLGWENVEIVKEMEKYLPLPITIANDADCAALGEAIAGAGQGCDNLVMITLGTGVGGGLIIDGKIYEGPMIGGFEFGHTVVVNNGELCTCGRRGCLEAYASATALKRDAKNAFGKDMTPLELFNLYHENDETAIKVVNNYIDILGTGIVNLVNMFRPKKILIGGGISAQKETLLNPIREKMTNECFGGFRTEVPELAIATLGNDAGMIGAANL